MERQTGKEKTNRNPVKIIPIKPLEKPSWIRVKVGLNDNYRRIKNILRSESLHTVCEEASCPNISECFGNGTATFMILGDLCTRRCPFCDVAHGRPKPPDPNEPEKLATAIKKMELSYVVITSVDRDDLRDGGANHFKKCIRSIRTTSPETNIEILVPDFRGRLDKALDEICSQLPDVLNHNLETVPRLYKMARPGANYQHSLHLLSEFKSRHEDLITKSGLMVGLGETDDEIISVMEDLKKHQVDMLTIGQYLQPSNGHLPVIRYLKPENFHTFKLIGEKMGFTHVASAPLVRSSYHADNQANKGGISKKQ